MTRGRNAGKLTIPRGGVPIKVYPFVDCQPIDGWILDGDLITAAGSAARGVKIKVGPPCLGPSGWEWWQQALVRLSQLGYRNVIQVNSTGTEENYA